MDPDEALKNASRRAIIDALGLSPHAAGKLLEALDARYMPRPEKLDDPFWTRMREAALAALAARTAVPAPAPPMTTAARWGVWCTPISTPSGRKAAWLGDDDGYVLRSTIEAIAAELNARTHAKHWHYEARPVLADGSPGPVPNVCTKCGVNSHDPAYATNGCFHTHYGEYTGFSTAVVDATSVKKVVEHCLGNDCADKAACECLCDRCCPPKEKR